MGGLIITKQELCFGFQSVFSNALLLCFGQFSSTHKTVSTVNLPTAYTTSTYAVSLMQVSRGTRSGEWINAIGCEGRTKTNFTYYQDQGERPLQSYITCGY